jgi:hypothetical protein
VLFPDDRSRRPKHVEGNILCIFYMLCICKYLFFINKKLIALIWLFEVWTFKKIETITQDWASEPLRALNERLNV